MEFINPESARQETTDGLKNKLKKNFETIDKDKSGVVTVEEMWYVNFLNYKYIQKRTIPLKSKKAGSFEKMLHFDSSHSILTHVSRAPPHPPCFSKS